MHLFWYMHTAARLQFIFTRFVLPFATLILATYGWQYAEANNFGRNEWAAWVQAIGSIAAIAVAFFVGNRSSGQLRQLERDRMQLEIDRRVEIINGILDHILHINSKWLRAVNQKNLTQIYAFDPDELDTLCAYLAAIPPLEIPSASIATNLIALPQPMKKLSGALRSISSAPLYRTPAVFDELIRSGWVECAYEIEKLATRAKEEPRIWTV